VQRCFAADSLVTLTNGQQKSISELQSGDNILAYNDKTKKVISTNVITMLDKQPHQFGRISHFYFYHIISFFSYLQTIDYDFWSSIITHFIAPSSN
jgi:hypothetical protein